MQENPTFPSFEIIRKNRRKRIAIRVVEGKVQILTPEHCPPKDALLFLNKHTRWVQTKLREQASITPYSPKQYINGEIFFYLGESYFLNIAYTKKPNILIQNKQLFVFIRETKCPNERKQKIHQQLYKWYWQEAEKQLQEKTNEYAQKLNVNYRSICIKQFKSRWGCCNTKGDIKYTWQIILAPHRIVDYLVVHELAHIKHHNHSPKFWQLVASIIPDYKECKNWLRTQGHLLRIE